MATIADTKDIEAAAKREFAVSASLRAEFGGDIDAYVAFKKNERRIRIRKDPGETTGGNVSPAQGEKLETAADKPSGTPSLPLPDAKAGLSGQVCDRKACVFKCGTVELL